VRAAIACLISLACVAPSVAQVRNWPSEGPPRPLAARDSKFPPYEIQTLPNGLQVVTVLHHEQPVVSMRLLLRAGSASDPKDRLGAARLAATLLDQGTTTQSAQELADTIDFIGGSMGAGAGTDLTHVNMIVMKDSFESGMRMLSDLARHPAFTQGEIDRKKQQALSGLQVSANDPEYVANAVFDRLVYGFHPYGMPDSGTPATLTAVTRSDLVAFHSRYFAPNNAILAIVGDVTAEEAFTTARKVFDDWQKRDLPSDKYIDPPDPARRVIVINKPDAVQTEVRVGHIGIPRSHPDYLAVNLAIRILGGEGSNRLHQILRTERGLTYGAQANMAAMKVSGDFEAETNTRSEATGEVLRLIVDEFWRLQRERVGERELADAKAYMTGSFPLTIETPDSIAMQVLNVIFYGLPLEELQNYRERVNAVTVDDIQRVARAYLRPDRLSVVLVGNAKAFASQLSGAGFGTYESIDLADLDLMSATLKRPAGSGRPQGALDVSRLSSLAARANYSQVPAGARPEAPQAPEEVAKAHVLLGRVLDAKGGLEKLRAVKTIVVKQTLRNPEGQARAFETMTYIAYPDRFRTESSTPGGGGANLQVFDGKQLWVKDARAVREIPETVARDVNATLRRDPVSMLVAVAEGKLRARALPDVKETGGRIDHALELSAPDFNPVVLLIDPQTWLINKLTFVSEAPGRPIVEEEFSDYREVDGVQFAFSGARKSGTQAIERRITDLKVNAPIDPALFKRPS
jgi:zinc protease